MPNTYCYKRVLYSKSFAVISYITMKCFKRATTNRNTVTKKHNVIGDVFQEYCTKTSVHGISYLGDQDKNLFEKILWTVVFVLCVILCSVQIVHTWTKWKNNPVIISISEAQDPISNIPFPAVTICPFNKIDKRGFGNFSKIYLKKETAGKKFWDVFLMCNERLHKETTTDEEAMKSIYDVAPRIIALGEGPRLNGKSITLYKQITEDGVCYTYNSFNQSDMYTDKLNPEVKLIENGYKNEGWNIENGYPEKSDAFTYPNRTRDGVKQGMRVLLETLSTSREFACGEPIKGFKISLHNPAEAPRTGQQYVLTPVDKLTVIAVNPKVITTSENLKDLDVARRNCYFSYEKSLYFFKVYTQNNCKSECLVNVTKKYCGCVGFYMPRDNNTKICGSIDCIYKIESALLSEFDVIKADKKMKNRERRAYEIYSACDCKPACASLDYEYDSSQTDYMWEEGFRNKRLELRAQMPLKWFEFTSVNIFFKESQFMALHRKELFSKTDFLASCGGLLGLFMGVSFVSILEIIYFVTVRLWCKIKNE